MGGTSSQTQSQNSTTAPWAAAQPTVNGLLGQLNPLISNSGITGAQTGALNTIEGNAANTAQYNPAIQDYTKSLLNGGGALNQAGAVNQNYQNYYHQTNPLASNTNYDPMSTPGIGDQLQALKDNITTSVNGSFAGAGRDFSGYNQKALGQGISAGLAPVLTNQYNTNVANQQGAASNLYNAGNTTAGIQTGLQQQQLANQGAGVSSVATGLDAQNAGANATLAAESQRTGIPIQQLGLLAQIGIPIAGLGSQTTGNASGTNTMSGAQQFGLIASGLASLGGAVGGTTTGTNGSIAKTGLRSLFG